MKLGYTIIYVPDVAASLAFFEQALGFEIALVTPEVAQAHAKALACGAAELAAPKQKPWGQLVSYVRCPDGILVELCSPIAG